MTISRTKPHHDKTLFIAVTALIIIGVVMVYSSSSVVALRRFSDPAYFMKRQIIWALIGLALMALATRTDHRIFDSQRSALGLVLISLALLAAVLAPGLGSEINGARRWLRLGGLGFQPAEFGKFTLAVYMSYYIAKKGQRIREFGNGLAPAFVVTGIFLGLVVLQPDFGAAVTLASVAFFMLFVGGANALHIAGVALSMIPFAYIAVAGTAYRARRIFAFLDPWAAPDGAGFQIIQSFLAFGGGGVLGRGLGEGRQKLLFLPEPHSDFIYAVIAEELGLAGALIVLALFFVILWRGMRIALRSGEKFSGLLAFGLTMLICMQGFTNMAVVTGLLPTKGLVLPFVSYGGSSLVISMVEVGVLLNISREAS